MLKGNRSVEILEDGQPLKSTELKPHRVYPLALEGVTERALLLTEPRTVDRSTYQKFTVLPGTQITVGRDSANHICFDNNFVSSCHAVLACDKDGWFIQDQHSTNGTFVNDEKITKCALAPGDVVFIMGMVVVIGKDFISVNNPDGKVFVNHSILKPFPIQRIERLETDSTADPEETGHDFFDRSPRFKRDISRGEIKIDSPPPSQNQNKLPAMLTLGPSMTMGMMSMASAGATVSQIISGEGTAASAVTSLMMSLSMILSCVMWPVLTKGFEKKEQLRAEKERQEKYTQYLQEVNDRIARECELQTEILHENFVSVADCVERIMLRKRNLWERSSNHNDFLTLRLGLGELPLDASIKYQEVESK